MEKSQKISSKIEFIGTYLNSLVSPEGTLGPLGVKHSSLGRVHFR